MQRRTITVDDLHADRGISFVTFSLWSHANAETQQYVVFKVGSDGKAATHVAKHPEQRHGGGSIERELGQPCRFGRVKHLQHRLGQTRRAGQGTTTADQQVWRRDRGQSSRSPTPRPVWFEPPAKTLKRRSHRLSAERMIDQ